MRRFFVLVFVIALILGLTACGGDEPAEPEPTAAPPAATEAPAATPMAEPTAALGDGEDRRVAFCSQ